MLLEDVIPVHSYRQNPLAYQPSEHVIHLILRCHNLRYVRMLQVLSFAEIVTLPLR